jgi:hypothetical protein
MGKEARAAYLQILSRHFAEALNKSTKNFGHDVRIFRPKFGPGTLTYEGAVLETAQCK